MTITQRLLDLDPTLKRFKEGNWQTPLVDDTGEFSSFNDAGIECETGEFLYSLVRLLKPDHVLETGTHWGVGASYMGLALKDNHKGHLDTLEFLPEIHSRAMYRIAVLGLIERITCHLIDAAKFTSNDQYGLILLDTEPQTRFAELVKYYPQLLPGGFVFIHDLHRHMHQIDSDGHPFAWPYGKIPPEMTDLILQGKLRPFHFSTPRGLTGFYKPDDKDYVW